MNLGEQDVDLENELVQLIIEEVVRLGMGSPLQEPILAGVERASEEPVVSTAGESEAETDDSADSRDTSKLVAGTVTFVALSVVLYLIFRFLTDSS